MGYRLFKFGSLYSGDMPLFVPQAPPIQENTPSYDGISPISFGSAVLEQTITWIMPDKLNLLIADRVLLGKISWNDLSRIGFVFDTRIEVNGCRFLCRLPQLGTEEGEPNEWGQFLDAVGTDSDDLWHWRDMYFWGSDISKEKPGHCAINGYFNPHNWFCCTSSEHFQCIGFRPILEPLESDAFVPACKLDGVDFRLTCIPDVEGLWPILEPKRRSVFAGIPDGAKVRMYTVVDGKTPIHMDEQASNATRLTLTDHYFGDEYLVPWTISNGVAIADKALRYKT